MPRFSAQAETVTDTATGLMWSKDAGLSEFPLTWQESLDFAAELNKQQFSGHADWRLPNRRELFSLVSHHTINPALPAGYPVENVFNGYYWTATTCARLPNQAWYVHLGGARVFKGMKHGSCMVWPVRGMPGSEHAGPDHARAVWRTGQHACYSPEHLPGLCRGSGQDGDLQAGLTWPQPRFEVENATVRDRMTGLVWTQSACIGSPDPVNWEAAGYLIRHMNDHHVNGCADWRLPTIRELESLCDMSAHSPALPFDHPFENVQAFYWSSTISQYDRQYAWVLYLVDGAVGVGFKPGAEFFAWAVRDGSKQKRAQTAV